MEVFITWNFLSSRNKLYTYIPSGISQYSTVDYHICGLFERLCVFFCFFHTQLHIFTYMDFVNLAVILFFILNSCCFGVGGGGKVRSGVIVLVEVADLATVSKPLSPDMHSECQE